MRHRGDIQFAFKQEFDGEKPLFLPSRLLSTVPFADPWCLVIFLPPPDRYLQVQGTACFPRRGDGCRIPQPDHFYKVFARVEGIPPSPFREERQKAFPEQF